MGRRKPEITWRMRSDSQQTLSSLKKKKKKQKTEKKNKQAKKQKKKNCSRNNLAHRNRKTFQRKKYMRKGKVIPTPTDSEILEVGKVGSWFIDTILLVEKVSNMHSIVKMRDPNFLASPFLLYFRQHATPLLSPLIRKV